MAEFNAKNSGGNGSGSGSGSGSTKLGGKHLCALCGKQIDGAEYLFHLWEENIRVQFAILQRLDRLISLQNEYNEFMLRDDEIPPTIIEKFTEQEKADIDVFLEKEEEENKPE